MKALETQFAVAREGSEEKRKTGMAYVVGCSLVFVTVFSWVLFPILLKFLAPSFLRGSFAVVFAVVFLLHWKYQSINRFEISKEIKLFFYLWGGYFLALTVATVNANVFYSYQQLLFLFLKAFFFFFLLLFVDRIYINKTFSIYANLMVVILIMALLVAIAVAIGGLEPIANLPNGVNIYWGSYYGWKRIDAPFTLYALQGFSEENGTFAFSLLPAFFWMLIVKKAKYRSLIIALGILATFSFGAILTLLIMTPILLKARPMPSTENMFGAMLLSVFVVICAMLLGGLLFLWSHHIDLSQIESWLSDVVAGRESSFLARVQETSVALNYLGDHPIGTGAGLGMMTVHSAIAVGFANAALESGVVGGVFYISMFSLLAWLAVKMVWTSDASSSENEIRKAIGLSVLTLIIMGAQRQQPDISCWHMWIYASFFYLNLKKNEIFIDKRSMEMVGNV